MVHIRTVIPETCAVVTDKGIVDECQHAVGMCLRCFVAGSKTVLSLHLSVGPSGTASLPPIIIQGIAIHYGPQSRALCSLISTNITEHREQPRDLCPRAHKSQDGEVHFQGENIKTKVTVYHKSIMVDTVSRPRFIIIKTF